MVACGRRFSVLRKKGKNITERRKVEKKKKKKIWEGAEEQENVRRLQ